MKKVIMLVMFSLVMTNASISYRETMLPPDKRTPSYNWSESYSSKNIPNEETQVFKFLRNIEHYFSSRNLTGSITDGRYEMLYIKTN